MPPVEGHLSRAWWAAAVWRDAVSILRGERIEGAQEITFPLENVNGRLCGVGTFHKRWGFGERTEEPKRCRPNGPYEAEPVGGAENLRRGLD